MNYMDGLADAPASRLISAGDSLQKNLSKWTVSDCRGLVKLASRLRVYFGDYSGIDTVISQQG